MSTLVSHAANTQSTASSAYSSLLQSDRLPSPQIYFPRLTALLKSLHESKQATLAVVKARTDLVKNLESLLERQKRELGKAESLLAEVEEQVKGVQATRDEVRNLIEAESGQEGGQVGERSTTPEVERPVVEALTPPSMPSITADSGVAKSEVKIETGDEFAGLENLDPEIVALLKADMGLNKNSTQGGESMSIDDGYVP